MNYQQILYEQLAKDFSISVEELKQGGNHFVRKKYVEGRRVYRNDRCLLNLLSIGGTGVAAGDSDMLLNWMRRHFDGYAAWLGEAQNLIQMDARLREYGSRLAGCHHYYIPDKKADSAAVDAVCRVQWFEREELGKFRGDSRFEESLAFSETAPDMLAVVGLDDNDDIIGTAGASADSPAMWQIGVKVDERARGRGVGAYLVWRLKNEVLRRGFLPFYGTAESHIESQRVAYRCGFIPAWWEACSD
ncbi:MAG: GNAT family N-acetyltransferase [Eubacteriales bacterium]